MMLREKSLSAALTFLVAGALGAYALAGKVISKEGSANLSQTMGLRVVSESVVDSKTTVQAQVVDAQRFAERGFAGAHVNDPVVIVELGPHRGSVKHNASGQVRNFKVRADGTIVRE